MNLISRLLAVVAAPLLAATLSCAGAVNEFSRFTTRYCLDCHDTETKKGGLDLSALRLETTDATNFATWVKIHDYVAAGEMPPKKKPRPAAADLRSFTNALQSMLFKADRVIIAEQGRATRRRLNRFEYEETLRDLLSLPYLEVSAFLPEDREAHGFNKIGDALDVSHVQLSRYLAAADFALHEAMAPMAQRPASTTRRYYTWEDFGFFGRIDLAGPLNRRTFPLIGIELQVDVMAEKDRQMPHTTDPVRREKESMAVVVSTYEPTEIRFGSFRAPSTGKYRLKLSAYSVWMDANYKSTSRGRRSEPVTVYAETPPRSMRRLGSFDVAPEPTVGSMEVWLLTGETIRPDAARLFRSRPPDHKNPLATAEGMPGVAFQWLEIEGPMTDGWPPASHELLFGSLPMKNREPSATEPEPPQNRRRRPRFIPPPGVEMMSAHPGQDASTLLNRFMEHVYRRPVQKSDSQRFLAVVTNAMATGSSFTDAMLAGYSGVLSSPAFLYLDEKPGRLDDVALAARLSYFLWNSGPDETLQAIATKGALRRPETLRQQTERLLNDRRSRRFVNAFLDYWLDLRLISGTAPDEQLYPEYQLDDLLMDSMGEESQLFFSELLRRDLPVRQLVASDFVMINERLATHYGIAGVDGVHLRAVPLPKDSERGGLLTQASVLKVTANGTTTSPVKRGAWIMARLLGRPPPPPPASVPAVEPDIRGATTIRAQLAAHRTEESCNACHRNIDPVGFALEAFDVMGARQNRYRSVGRGDPVKGIGHNGNFFRFSLGQPVDCAGELWDGRRFADVRQLKDLLLADEEQIARNLARQLTVYATGSPIRFSDRPAIEKMLANSRAQGYGVRRLVHELVQSDLFRNK